MHAGLRQHLGRCLGKKKGPASAFSSFYLSKFRGLYRRLKLAGANREKDHKARRAIGAATMRKRALKAVAKCLATGATRPSQTGGGGG